MLASYSSNVNSSKGPEFYKLLYLVVQVIAPHATRPRSISQPLFLSLVRRLGQQAFDTWFRPLKVTKSPAERVLQISAPNAVVRDWIICITLTSLRIHWASSSSESHRIEWSLAMSESRDRSEMDPQEWSRVRTCPSVFDRRKTMRRVCLLEYTERAERKVHLFKFRSCILQPFCTCRRESGR